MLHVGVDVGGTFTDVVAADDIGRVYYTKTSSTPEDSSIGVVRGICQLVERVGMKPADVALVVHGTTVATNAVLERTGAPTGLLTTKGFRDILHIGRQSRPHLYDIRARRPDPLVPRHWRLEVPERTLHTGEVIEPVDEETTTAAIRKLAAEGVSSLAVCLLHSYANPINEQRVRTICQSVCPALAVSLSSDIQSEFREYERISTTVLNAYVQPVVQHYLSRLGSRLKEAGIQSAVLIMQSSGGVMTPARAAQKSVHTLLSGPAAGVLAGVALAGITKTDHLITADVGGTSFDVAVVRDGEAEVSYDGEVGGIPIRLPHISIHTIGSGGGSICWVDSGGALRVGPHSAGAVPGPVCYGRGGTEPTVTDAHAVLGRVSHLLSGDDLVLDVEAAQEAISRQLAHPLGNISVEAAAEGVLRVANESMARAVRVITIERGLDLRRFTLVAFGGAGPMHSSDVARALGVRRVLIPRAPGNFSCLGLLVAPIRYEEVRTYVAKLNDIDETRAIRAYAAMEAAIRARAREDGTSDSKDIIFLRYADVRYCGQAYEITVPVPGSDLNVEAWRTVAAAFHETHEQLYGFRRPGEPIQVVNLRLTALGQRRDFLLQTQVARASAEPLPYQWRRAFFAGGWVKTPVYRRDSLCSGHALQGPAIVEETGATTVLAPGDTAIVDSFGNILVRIH